MTDQFHVGTFLWGVVLIIAGVALAAVGFGWWDLSSIDLRYVAPVFVILVGGVLVLGALMPRRHETSSTDSSA